MTSVLSTDQPPPAPGSTRGAKGRPRGSADAHHPWRPLLVRMHFYAGVLVAPFVVLVCLTGLLYTFTPQIERMIYAKELTVESAGRIPKSLTTQVEAALAAMPNRQLSAITPGVDPDRTTRVDFADPTLGTAMAARSVFVDPYTAEVRGELVTRHGVTPFSSWLSELHGSLHLGEFGRIYAELASAWLVVLVLGGLLLWWERATRHGGSRTGGFWRRFLWVNRRHRGLHKTMSWHSSVGVWMSAVALVLALTGLMIAPYAGPKWTALMAQLNSSSPRLSATLTAAPSAAPPAGPTTAKPGAAMPGVMTPGATTPTAPAPAGQPAVNEHAGHGAPVSAVITPGRLPVGFGPQEILDFARTAGITHEVRLSAPTKPGTGWVAAESDLAWPVHLDQAVIDPNTGDAVRTLTFSEWPVLAQAYRLALMFHFGRTFGLLNQIILAVTMVGLLASIVWGYQMWWQRRPKRAGWRLGRAPRRGAWRGAPRGRLFLGAVLSAAVMWTLPVLGVSVLAFLALDAALGIRARRHLTHPPVPEAELHDASRSTTAPR